MSTYSHTNPADGAQIIGCAYCIDGHIPATDSVLGPGFDICPNCPPPCGTCGPDTYYPAPGGTLSAYILDLNTAANLIPVLCSGCGGIMHCFTGPNRHPGSPHGATGP